jgi:hypothetical protein
MKTSKTITRNRVRKFAVAILAFALTIAMVGTSAVAVFADKPAKSGGVAVAAPPTGAETAGDLADLISDLGANDNVVLSGDIEIPSDTDFGNMAGKTVWLNGFSFRITARNISIDFGGLVLDGDGGMGGISGDVAGADTDVLRISNAELQNIMGQNEKGVIVIGKNNDTQRLDTVLTNISIVDCTEDMVSLHGDCVLNNVTVKGCTSSMEPMVKQNMDNKSLTLNDCKIQNNECTRESNNTVLAAGVFSWGDLNINNSIISDNRLPHANFGGGAFSAGNVHITGSTISGNTSNGYGGGLVVYDFHQISPTVIIEGSEISNNSAGIAGGGIFAFAPGATSAVDVTITDTTVSDNHTQNLGGGIYNNRENAIHLNGSTVFSGNTAGNASTNNMYPARSALLIAAVPQSKVYNGQEQSFNNLARITGLRPGDKVYYKKFVTYDSSNSFAEVYDYIPLDIDGEGMVTTDLITMKYPGQLTSYIYDNGIYKENRTVLLLTRFIIKDGNDVDVTADYNKTYSGQSSAATIIEKPATINITVGGVGVQAHDNGVYTVREGTPVDYAVSYDGIVDDFVTTDSATRISAGSGYSEAAVQGDVFESFLVLQNNPIPGAPDMQFGSGDINAINGNAVLSFKYFNSFHGPDGGEQELYLRPYNFTVNFPSIKVVTVKDELKAAVITGTGVRSSASVAIDAAQKRIDNINDILAEDADALSPSQLGALESYADAVEEIRGKLADLDGMIDEALDVLKDASATQLAIDEACEDMLDAISAIEAAIDALTNAETGAEKGLDDALGTVAPTQNPDAEVGVTYIYKGDALPAAPTGYYNEAGSYDWSAQAKADMADAEAGEYDVDVLFTPDKAIQYASDSFTARVAVLDKEALDDKIKEANGLLGWARKNIGDGEGKISQATYDALENAIGAAQEVADKAASEVAQDDIDAALVALESAVGAVRLTAGGLEQATKPGITTPAKSPNVQKIRTPLKTIYLTKGKSYKLAYVLDGPGGKPINDPKLAFSVSKTGKAAAVKVSWTKKGSSGIYRIKAQKLGKSTVTFKAQNGTTLKVKVVVQKKKAALKKFSAKLSKKLKKGKSYQIKISGLTKKASNVGTVTFKSSKKSIAKVDAAGKVTALKKGTVKITVKIGTKKVVKKLTVK